MQIWTNGVNHWGLAIALAVILQGTWPPLPQATASVQQNDLADSSSASANQPLSGEALLQAYYEAREALPPLPALQYRQQIRVSGSTEYNTTVDMLYRQDGSWQAWLYEGNRARLLDSTRLKPVSQTDVAKLYGTYVTDPNAMAVEETWSLNATPEDYRVETVEMVRLGDRIVYYLTLEPSQAGWLRELWLDPERYLPVRLRLAPSTRWGDSSVTIEFAPVDRYWLPQKMHVALDYWFLSFPGLLQVRSFEGALEIEHEYWDYTFLVEGKDPLHFSANQPSATGQLATVVGAVPPSTASATNRRDRGGLNSPVQLDASLTDRQMDSTLATKVADYNATQPGLHDGRKQFDTISLIHLGNTVFPIYLLRFDVEGSLTPGDRNSRRNGIGDDSLNGFGGRAEPHLRFFGTEN